MRDVALIVVSHSRLVRGFKFHCRFDPEIYKTRHKPPRLLYTTPSECGVYVTPSDFMTRHRRELLVFV